MASLLLLYCFSWSDARLQAMYSYYFSGYYKDVSHILKFSLYVRLLKKLKRPRISHHRAGK